MVKKKIKKSKVIKNVRGKKSAKKLLAGKKRIMIPSLEGMSAKLAAAAVCTYLGRSGHDAVLLGAGCAAVYGGASIKPKLLEFAVGDYSIDSVTAVMKKLGFKLVDYRLYSSGKCRFEIMLAPKPVALGDDVAEDINVIKTSAGSLNLLAPTDCVRQRLSVFYHWGDRSALSEAVLVAKHQKVDMEFVKRWSDWEWSSDRFQEFIQRLDN